LLRTAVDEEEREEMVRGRSLESNGSSLESSQRAKRVSIRSSISSISISDFGFGAVAVEDDDSAIFGFRFDYFPLFSNKVKLVEKWKIGMMN
jgi:hypothetical protein